MNKIMYLLPIILLLPAAYADTSEQTITVSITDNEFDTSERVDQIVYSIYSNTIYQDKYAGWNNALSGTGITLELVDDDADITITLVNYPSPNEHSAYTIQNHITLYDIDKLSNHQIQMLIRHEIGHTLGLEHSSDPNDLMNVIIPYYNSYISKSNIELL